MIALERISDAAIIRTWESAPASFVCPLGTVDGATVGWQNGDYRLVEVADPDPVAPTIGELKSYAAAKRYAVETSGVIWSGHIIQTDRDSQSKLIAEFVAISAGLRAEPSTWKFADGFVALTNTEMGAVIMAARNHVAACFDKESDVVNDIESETITTFAEIDSVDWPSNA